MDSKLFLPSQFINEDDELVAKWTETRRGENHTYSDKIIDDELTMHFSEEMLPKIEAAIKEGRRIRAYYCAGLNGGHDTAEKIEVV